MQPQTDTGTKVGPALDNPIDPLSGILRRDKESYLNYRLRRHEEWTENYTLYRDKVILNRLTQRQSVNVPMMKYTIKTILKDIDDAPLLNFHSLDNNDQAEIYFTEVWKWSGIENKLILKDIVDKKQVLLYGRSFKKLNIVDGKFSFTVEDPQDILIDRYVDPTHLDSTRGLIHEHIYRPLSVIAQNKLYDKDVIEQLKIFYASDEGLVKADNTMREVIDKNKRMQQLGVPDVNNPILGETYIELNEHYRFMWDDKKGKEVIFLITTADTNMMILLKKPLYEIIGETSDHFWDNHYPFVSWGDDIDGTDFWSDGAADIIRTPNKVLNAWLSQLVENRTLRNFGMNYYNSSNKEFVPQTFVPVPWGWYPVPGNPAEVVQHVDIQPLENSIQDINFLTELAEKAVGSNALQQGALPTRHVTLGEVQLVLANARARVKAISIFYHDAWIEFGYKYVKMMEAASDLIDPVTISIKGRLGLKMHTRVIAPQDWATKSGYTVEVQNVSDMMQEEVDELQKLNAAKAAMPNNQPLDEIYKKKLLQYTGLTRDEQTKVMEAEKQAAKDAAAAAAAAQGGEAGGPLGAIGPALSIPNGPTTQRPNGLSPAKQQKALQGPGENKNQLTQDISRGINPAAS